MSGLYRRASKEARRVCDESAAAGRAGIAPVQLLNVEIPAGKHRAVFSRGADIALVGGIAAPVAQALRTGPTAHAKRTRTTAPGGSGT